MSRQNDLSFCAKHRRASDQEPAGWAPQPSLPCVKISLKVLSGRIHSLLDSHSGFLPVASVVDCHDALFPDQALDQTGKPSVPLEHLISCIRGIEITSHGAGVKAIRWTEKDKEQETGVAGLVVPRPETRSPDEGSRQLLSFSREVRGLLKHQATCTIPFAKFVPIYHSHFGKQCCVQNYGFSKLIELLEAIPHVVQILGNQKSLTLTHREQVRRFVSDLLRVLRSHADEKRLLLHQLPLAFEAFFGKAFSVSDYGVCFLEDLLADVWEGAVQLLHDESGVLVGVQIPRREQTPAEKGRMRAFARELVELLKTMPNLSIPFSKFIPTYHHFFRRQCRLSDYGFQKLADLFEALSPHTVDVRKRGPDDEDLICLSARIRCKILWDRMSGIMRSRSNCSLSRVCDVYRQRYGHSLTSDDFASARLTHLIQTFSRTGSVPANTSYVRSTRTYLSCRKPQQIPGPPVKWIQSSRQSSHPTSSSLRSTRGVAPSLRIQAKGVTLPEKENEAPVCSQSLEKRDSGCACVAGDDGRGRKEEEGEDGSANGNNKTHETHKITKRLAIRFDSRP